MVILMLMALMGAVLGALTKPRFAAAPIAVAFAEGMRWLVGILAASSPDAPIWATWSFAVVSDPLDDYLPLLAVSVGSSVIAATITMVYDRHQPRDVPVSEATRLSRQVRNGRFVRAEGKIGRASCRERV